MEQIIYDIIGIGIGPFNLGLAALASEVLSLQTLFFDSKECFSWHSGMMLEGTRLQVPFHADLVTQVNPQSPFSFLAYLKHKKRLYRFTIAEKYFPLRKEYNDYCRWAAGKLRNLRFGCRCTTIDYDEVAKLYRVHIQSDNSLKAGVYYTKHVVIGIGTVPFIPTGIEKDNPNIFHSSEYLQKKDILQNKDRITVIGSGQSAGEIFYNLLNNYSGSKQKLSWFTSSDRIFPMDYSKFALEMASPDYINHFYGLSEDIKERLLHKQSNLYKGINFSLIDELYDKLYALSLEDGFKERIHIQSACRLISAVTTGDTIDCRFIQKENAHPLTHATDVLITATGYQTVIPDFLHPIKDRINRDEQQWYKVNRNYSIDNDNSLFVQNAELHTHGFNAPDLGMGPYRNAIILNTILGEAYFETERDVPFQTF